MSAQSIIHNTDSKVSKQISTSLQKLGKQFLLKYRFDVGKEPNINEIRLLTRLSKMFCEDSCAICEKDMNLVKEKINRSLIFNNPEL